MTEKEPNDLPIRFDEGPCAQHKTIHKYSLEMVNQQKVVLPKNARILTIQFQEGDPKLWYLFDTKEEETEERLIELFGTGHILVYNEDIARKYISTVVEEELVFHFFERNDA